MVEQKVCIETYADRVLKEMCDYLGSHQAFSFQVESSYDALDRDNQKIRYGGIIDVDFCRPDGLREDFNGDEKQTLTIYDGQAFTIYDKKINMYSVIKAAPTIGASLDKIFEMYDITVPLADIVYDDPYSNLIANIIKGRWIGLHTIAGVPCNHLAFTQESVDWQIWIEATNQPVPRQVLITYKDEEGWPQFIARLRNWDFQPSFPDGHFHFSPPEGSDEMEFLMTQETEANND